MLSLLSFFCYSSDGLMIDYLAIYFFVYSFIGYICEVLYCSIPQKRFVNRGFLYGPWLPIYGFGGLIVVIFLDPLSSYPIAVFIFAFLLTSVLEYFTSWLLEKLFSVKLWDYSRMKVNINGRVCLLNSTLFGIMGLAAEYIVQPFMSRIVHDIPSACIHSISILIAVLLSVDATLSIIKMKAFKDELRRVRIYRKAMEARIAELLSQNSRERADELRTRFEHEIDMVRGRLAISMGRIVRANPSITSRSNEIRYQLGVLSEWSKKRKELKARFKEEMKALDDENMAKLRGNR